MYIVVSICGLYTLFFFLNLQEYTLEYALEMKSTHSVNDVIRRKGACVPVDRALDSRSNGLVLNIYCCSCEEVLGKLLNPMLPGATNP